MARVPWPDREALGQCIRIGGDTMPCREVVGVAQDIRRGRIGDETMLQFYVPWQQYFYGMPRIVVARTRGPASDLAESLRRELQRAVGSSVYVRVQPLEERVALQTRSWRVGATVFSVFGCLALALVALGLFSVVGYDVTQRTREFGVRLAVGARGLDLVLLVLRDSVRLAVVGLGLGLGAAWLLGSSVEDLLFGVPARDPATFSAVALLLLVTAVLAALTPALRSARVQPNRVLRVE